MLGNVLLTIYLLVALVFMLHTIFEWRQSDTVTLAGMLAGCAMCLLWLPALLAMGAYQGLLRIKGPGRV